jgi:integrase/recombinase XerD
MAGLPKIALVMLEHRGTDVICLKFKYDPHLTTLVRRLDARWSATHTCWYVENKKGMLEAIRDIFHGEAEFEEPLPDRPVETSRIVGVTQPVARPQPLAVTRRMPAASGLPPITPEKEEQVQELIRYMRSRRYSESTVSTYSESLRIFFRYYTDKPVPEIDNNDLVVFNNEYILKNHHSSSYQNQVINAIKLYYNNILRKKLQPELVHRPKRAKVLPNVLSKEEVKRILLALNNNKHRCMLSLIYSCGLRCSELLRLEPRHIDEHRGLLVIKQSKGRRDRIAPLSKLIVIMIREYTEIHKPVRYLFEGQNAGEMYDERSLQQVLKNAVSKAGINKPVTLHWLRHSYATHLLENGTDLRYIQEILGHASSRTTEIYTHVSNLSIQRIVSPFDIL